MASEVIGKCATCGGDVTLETRPEFVEVVSRHCPTCKAFGADVVLVSEAQGGALFSDVLELEAVPVEISNDNDYGQDEPTVVKHVDDEQQELIDSTRESRH